MGPRGPMLRPTEKGPVSRSLGIFLLLAFFAAPAVAGGLVRGEGFRFRVPPEFETSPSESSQELRAQLEELVSGAALPVSGSPGYRSRVNKVEDVQIGTLVSLCYRLPPGTGITDVAQIEGERMSLGFQAIDPDRNRPTPRVKQREVGRARMGLEVRLDRADVPGEIWCVFAIDNGHLLVLAYQRELPSESDEAWWGATLSSIHLEQHGAAQGVTTTILAAGALIGLLLLWLTIRVVRHRRSMGAMRGPIIMEGNAGVRDGDDLESQFGIPLNPEPETSGEHEAPEPEEEPEEAPYPFRFGLPPLEEKPEAEAPQSEPTPAQPEPASVTRGSTATTEPEAASEPPAERPAKGTTLRIQRNNDFIS